MSGRNEFHFDPALVAIPASGALADHLPQDFRDVHVEIGFGKDIRTLRVAAQEPQAWFLGVEISRKRAASFCRKVARAGLRNVRAINGDARFVLREMMAPGSIASFTILFPDPWPKRRHHKNRWIQEDTTELLVRALRPGGLIVAATDHDHYLAQIRRLFAAAELQLEFESPTVPADDSTLFARRFEQLGETMCYMRWRKNEEQ